MASGTNYSQEYGQAEKAYLQGNFDLAAEIVDNLAEEFPENPNVLLLKGHIYFYGFQDYDLAQQLYEAVLGLSEEQDLIDFAHSHLEKVKQLPKQEDIAESPFDEESFNLGNQGIDATEIDEIRDSIGVDLPEDEEDFNDHNYNFAIDDLPSQGQSSDDFTADLNPFADNDEENSEAHFRQFDSPDFELDHPTAIEENEYLPDPPVKQEPSTDNNASFMVDSEQEDDLYPDYTDEELASSESEEPYSEYPDEDFTFARGGEQQYEEPSYDDYRHSDVEVDTVLTEPFSVEGAENYGVGEENYGVEENAEHEGLDYQDELEFDEIDSSFFDLEELEQGLPDTGLFDVAEDRSNVNQGVSSSNLIVDSDEIEPDSVPREPKSLDDQERELEKNSAELEVELDSTVKPGILAGFINAPMRKKQLITAGLTGIVSTIAVLGIGLVGVGVTSEKPEEMVKGARNSALMALVAGIASFGTATAVGSITAKQVQKASRDLLAQFDDVYQGNLNAKATVYTQDEFGKLATGFNRMTRVILTTTQEAQRRAEETEQAKEDLQRQVIRLLDDVEGAARGDLTVQATVTADVLGAVADAFNLTIQNLREIVRQVKEAAEQVNKSSTDSELFARNQSSEALRMAEELAVTLNSVQMMTESIERVADNAREAEEVARSSSVTALKGGKAVERTVSGIFQIRETVSETARKVKRLAEASQEISKIVLLISQIAERTNQLALNASIQAAKAGEAGRGFAVVADEVRQLADRSGKSLKEIEQIVLQIQSETGAVMTAMEEGIQEVIDVTERAEQAKTALEDIIQVSNRIDTLVRSITADTVEQRENSRAVAQVMQSVELTAQATSQESQRVGGALQNLVGIARGLLASVERFRIDKTEE
ncbi:MAG: methyl-accepting chemotaxis protein [Pleurocapsa sp.]